MRVNVNEVSSHLCKILKLIIVRTYLQTGQRRYRIARRSVAKATSHSIFDIPMRPVREDQRRGRCYLNFARCTLPTHRSR